MSEVIDRENGIWIAEIPVRAQHSGCVVMCNEEAIGWVETDTGEANCFDAMVGNVATNRWGFKSMGLYRTIEAAARAVAIHVLGTDIIAGPLMDEDDPQAWDQAVDAYILSGVGAG